MNDSASLTDLTLPQTASESAVVALTAVAHAVCHVGELIFVGAILAIMSEFRLPPHEATLLVLLGNVLMGAGAIPAGAWADAWGPRRVLLLYFLAMAAGGVTVALAQDTWQLFAALTLLGLATSIYHPVGVALLSLGVRPQNRGRAMGINGVAGSIGVAVGPVLGLFAAGFGAWRLAYVVLAVLALVAGVAMYLVCRTDPVPVPRRAVIVPSLTDDPIQGTNWLPLVLLFGAMMIGGLNYRCLVTALPPHLSEVSAGELMVFFALVAGGIGQFLGGWGVDRFGARHIYPLLIAGLVPSAVLLGVLGGTPMAVPMACFLAVFLFGQQPVENSLMAEWTAAGRRSLSYGTKFALTFGVGALGGPIAGLIWYEVGSVGPVFYLVAMQGALMGALVLTATRGARSRKRQEREAASGQSAKPQAATVQRS
ncbi:MAG: MFS transporter [Gemmataceae bacterium]|nr:MFS transporter [Gemmataceae bacterium]